jgi:3-hydroxyisobutyrate dehydrogenase-like beta-hydroxyacid dehydrogenase
MSDLPNPTPDAARGSVREPLETVALIGLGEMGLPMARRLVDAGYGVVGYDTDRGRAEAAGTAGVRVAESSAAAASQADHAAVVVVRTQAQVESVLAELAADGGRGLELVVMSTVDPTAMERLAVRAAGAGIVLVDAPVSGGRVGAEEGTLAVMAAGPRATLERLRPLLSVLGANVFDLGEAPGAGQAAKLVNQTMMAVAMAGTAEGLALARRYGLDEGEVARVVSAGTGASWVLAHWGWMRSLWEEYSPGNGIDILDKDIRALLVESERRGLDLPLVRASYPRLLELWGR